MPWREVSIVEQREEFVSLALAAGANMSELCRRFGISREKGYKWLRRFAAEGRAGLEDRSRRPHASPLRTKAAVEAEVLRVRALSNEAWGGRKIQAVLRREGLERAPAASTITAILRRHGRLEGKRSQHPGPWRRFEHARPNDLWQMDFKGDFALGQGRCHPLTVIDDHSRYALAVEALADEREAGVRDRLTLVFRRHGLPLAMLMDNGPPWGDPGLERHTRLTAWLLRLGVRVCHGRPYHPQTQGKDERFHRTLKAEVLAGRGFADLARCQKAFDGWRVVYNTERPHEALGLAVPAERYRMSPRAFPEGLPALDYGPGDIVRKVDANGRISFRNRAWRIGKAFRGEPVALRPTPEDGVYAVHYGAHPIGRVDLRSSPEQACGLVDDALAPPTGSTGQQQQHSQCH